MQTISRTESLAAPAALSRRAAQQQRRRERSLQRLAKLRTEAIAEIERLITFLDQSDPYVMTELEPILSTPENHHWQSGEIEDGLCGVTDDREIDGDELDASYPEGSNASRVLAHPNEDDEDGADDEPSIGYDDDSSVREDDRQDDEPSLGWTESGQHGGTYLVPDGEIGPSARLPQMRTDLGAGLTIKRDWWRPRLSGLTAAQAERLRAAKNDARTAR